MKLSSHQCGSTWNKSLVLVRKVNCSLMLCLDPKDLNKNIKRNQYYTKTIDVLSVELHGSEYFTLMDTKSGYWIVQLDKEGSLLTTFNAQRRKFRWLWLLFGLSVSSGVFQERLDAVIKIVPDIRGIAAILAKGDSEINHDRAVLCLLETTQNNNLNQP